MVMKCNDFDRQESYDDWLRSQNLKEETAKGIRLNAGKVDPSLVPPEAIMFAAEAFTSGLKKYPAYNWAKGMEYSKVYGSLQRHLLKWWSGEDLDQESKLNHIKHAIANLSILAYYIERESGSDDRPGRAAP